MSEKPETTEMKAPEETKTAPGQKKKKKGKKRRIVRKSILTLFILLILGVAGWSLYSKLEADYRVTYDPYTATTGSISNSLSFTGSIQLVDSTNYTAEADTKVREVYVAAGDKVKNGDRLMRLSTGTVAADFDGTVSVVDAAKGDEVKAGDSLVTVSDFDHMKVSVRIGESNISEVAVGVACKVAVPSANTGFDAKIDAIDYSTYTGNNVAYYTATILVDTSGTDNVWPGMQATVTVTKEEANDVTILKMDALSTTRNNTAFVYKENEQGEMEEVPVTVGVSNGNYVEIKSGVTSGETIYKVAEKEEEPTGLAALFSGMFSNTRVNRQDNRNWRNRNNGGDMPDFSNMQNPGDMPSFPSGGNGGAPGGSRGN